MQLQRQMQMVEIKLTYRLAAMCLFG